MRPYVLSDKARNILAKKYYKYCCVASYFWEKEELTAQESRMLKTLESRIERLKQRMNRRKS